jgi:hypothetical protein
MTTEEKPPFWRTRTCLYGAAAIIIIAVTLLAWPNHCVLAGTPVATPDGARPIESLRAGDAVLVRAPDGRVVEGRVVVSTHHRARGALRLDLGERWLDVTAGHPVFVHGRGFVEAGDLAPGDSLLTREGPARLVSVTAREGTFDVVDLTVEPHPTFFAAGVLVHNKTPRKTGNEQWAISGLKTINTSQTLFREGDKEGDGTLDYGTLAELSAAGLVDPVLGSGTQGGYRFDVRPHPLTSEFLWFATANPIEPGRDGDRYFYTNEAGIIYYTTARAFDIATIDTAVPADARPVGK